MKEQHTQDNICFVCGNELDELYSSYYDKKVHTECLGKAGELIHE